MTTDLIAASRGRALEEIREIVKVPIYTDTGREMLIGTRIIKIRRILRAQAAEEEKHKRIVEIKSELTTLQSQYEKKMQGGKRGAMVPPSIKSSALEGITKKMDKLDAELAVLEGMALAEIVPPQGEEILRREG